MINGLTSTVIKAIEGKQEEYYDEWGWKGITKFIGMCFLEGIIDGILIAEAVKTVVSVGKIIFK